MATFNAFCPDQVARASCFHCSAVCSTATWDCFGDHSTSCLVFLVPRRAQCRDQGLFWGSASLRCVQITAQAFTFLLAGYETTANALAFATYLLALNPNKEAKMIEEIDAFGRDATPDYDDLPKVRTVPVDSCSCPSDAVAACREPRHSMRAFARTSALKHPA